MAAPQSSHVTQLCPVHNIAKCEKIGQNEVDVHGFFMIFCLPHRNLPHFPNIFQVVYDTSALRICGLVHMGLKRVFPMQIR